MIDTPYDLSVILITIIYPYYIVSMFYYLYTLCFSNNPDRFWLRTVLLVAMIMVCVLFYKRQNLAPYYEGFSQDKRFVMKQNNDIYDDFYVSIYDRLMETEKRAHFVVDQVIQMTQPSMKTSVFLDIGSGTGHLLHRIQEGGYQAYGLDKSYPLISKTEVCCITCSILLLIVLGVI